MAPVEIAWLSKSSYWSFLHFQFHHQWWIIIYVQFMLHHLHLRILIALIFFNPCIEKIGGYIQYTFSYAGMGGFHRRLQGFGAASAQLFIQTKFGNVYWTCFQCCPIKSSEQKLIALINLCTIKYAAMHAHIWAVIWWSVGHCKWWMLRSNKPYVCLRRCL